MCVAHNNLERDPAKNRTATLFCKMFVRHRRNAGSEVVALVLEVLLIDMSLNKVYLTAEVKREGESFFQSAAGKLDLCWPKTRVLQKCMRFLSQP